MAAIESKLMVFAHLGPQWAPCGQLLMTEEGPNVLASSFAYGLNYLRRPDALEVDPVSLGIADRDQVLGKRLLPVHGLPLFGGIRDAAPDAWGRRVIEAKLKVPAHSLPESQYLLHAGSDRVGALDVRPSIHDRPTPGQGAPRAAPGGGGRAHRATGGVAHAGRAPGHAHPPLRPLLGRARPTAWD